MSSEGSQWLRTLWHVWLPVGNLQFNRGERKTWQKNTSYWLQLDIQPWKVISRRMHHVKFGNKENILILTCLVLNNRINLLTAFLNLTNQ